MTAGREDFNIKLKYRRLFAPKENLREASFFGGTHVMKCFASSVDTIDSPISGSSTCV
jgi:hypothetical protein